VTDKTLPLNYDGSVHVEFNIVNTTDTDAVDSEVNFQICDECRYAKEPEGLQKGGARRRGTKTIALKWCNCPRFCPVTFSVATAILLAIAALACVVPARRVMLVDPWRDYDTSSTSRFESELSV
jgi:hypothetical protein